MIVVVADETELEGAEQIVGAAIRDQMSDAGGIAVFRCHVAESRGGSVEVDALVCTPQGATVVEVKGFTERQAGILATPPNGPWTIDGEPAALYHATRVPNPFVQVRRQVFAVKNMLQQAGIFGWVNAVIALVPQPGSDITLEETRIADGYRAVLVDRDDSTPLHDYFHAETGRTVRLSVHDVARVFTALNLRHLLPTPAALAAQGFPADLDVAGTSRPATPPPVDITTQEPTPEPTPGSRLTSSIGQSATPAFLAAIDRLAHRPPALDTHGPAASTGEPTRTTSSRQSATTEPGPGESPESPHRTDTPPSTVLTASGEPADDPDAPTEPQPRIARDNTPEPPPSDPAEPLPTATGPTDPTRAEDETPSPTASPEAGARSTRGASAIDDNTPSDPNAGSKSADGTAAESNTATDSSAADETTSSPASDATPKSDAAGATGAPNENSTAAENAVGDGNTAAERDTADASYTIIDSSTVDAGSTAAGANVANESGVVGESGAVGGSHAAGAESGTRTHGSGNAGMDSGDSDDMAAGHGVGSGDEEVSATSGEWVSAADGDLSAHDPDEDFPGDSATGTISLIKSLAPGSPSSSNLSSSLEGGSGGAARTDAADRLDRVAAEAGEHFSGVRAESRWDDGDEWDRDGDDWDERERYGEDDSPSEGAWVGDGPPREGVWGDDESRGAGYGRAAGFVGAAAAGVAVGSAGRGRESAEPAGERGNTEHWSDWVERDRSARESISQTSRSGGGSWLDRWRNRPVRERRESPLRRVRIGPGVGLLLFIALFGAGFFTITAVHASRFEMSDYDRMCGDNRTPFPNAAAYERDGPSPIYLSGDLGSMVTRDDARAWRPTDPSTVQLIACMKQRELRDLVQTCQYAPAPGEPIGRTVNLFQASYEVVVYELQTGREVARAIMFGDRYSADPSNTDPDRCRAAADAPDVLGRRLGQPSAAQVTGFLTPVVHPDR